MGEGGGQERAGQGQPCASSGRLEANRLEASFLKFLEANIIPRGINKKYFNKF
jgi:hypothetical protein